MGFSTKYCSFDGVDERMEAPNSTVYQFEYTNPFSISLWVRTTAADGTLCAKMNNGVNASGWRVDISSGKPRLTLSSNLASSQLRVRGEAALNDGEWHHLVCTFDGTGVSGDVDIYLDDSLLSEVEESDTLISSIVTSWEVNVACRGRAGFGHEEFIEADIDEVSIFDDELTSGEVTEIYNAGEPGDLSTSSVWGDVVAWWRMGEGAAFPTIPDDSVNSNDGTLTNMEAGDIEDYPIGISSWECCFGFTQGRIGPDPENWIAPEGGYVFCLGSDVLDRYHLFRDGDYIEVYQTRNFGANSLIRFLGRTRGPSQLPKVAEVTSAAVGDYTITVDSTDYVYSAGSSDTTVSIAQGLADLINADSSAIVTPILVGDASIIQLDAIDPDTDWTLMTVGNLTASTFELQASMLVDDSIYWSQKIVPGYTRDKSDVGGMVRNISSGDGDHKVTFRLELISTPSDAIAQIELPAFYIDSIALIQGEFAPWMLEGLVWWGRSDEVVLSGSDVDEWKNLSFSGAPNATTNISEANRPGYVSSGGSNDRPYIIFDKANSEAMQVLDHADLDLTTEATIVFIVSHFASSTHMGIAEKGSVGSSYNYGVERWTDLKVRAIYDSGTYDDGVVNPTPNSASIVIVRQSATETKFRVDGSDYDLLGQSNTLTTNSEPLHIGGVYTGSWLSGSYGSFADCRIYEVMVFDHFLSTADCMYLEAYKLARYLA